MFKIQLMESSNWSIKDGRLFNTLGYTTSLIDEDYGLTISEK